MANSDSGHTIVLQSVTTEISLLLPTLFFVVLKFLFAFLAMIRQIFSCTSPLQLQYLISKS